MSAVVCVSLRKASVSAAVTVSQLPVVYSVAVRDVKTVVVSFVTDCVQPPSTSKTARNERKTLNFFNFVSSEKISALSKSERTQVY